VIQQPGQKAWVALPQTPARQRADGSGSGWFPVVEITNRDVLDRVREAVLAAWEQRQQRGVEIIPPGGITVVHRLEHRDPRQAHIDELARRFDERGPDDLEGAL
jgi:hypothetical protein